MNIKGRKDAAAFARIWNSAPDYKTAVKRLGLNGRSASMRAGQYRERHGIPLQRFGAKGAEVDWEHVRMIARNATAKRLLREKRGR